MRFGKPQSDVLCCTSRILATADPLQLMQDARLGTSVAKIVTEAQDKGFKYFACNGCYETDWEKVRLKI